MITQGSISHKKLHLELKCREEAHEEICQTSSERQEMMRNLYVRRHSTRPKDSKIIQKTETFRGEVTSLS